MPINERPPYPMVPGTASTGPIDFEKCPECGGSGTVKKAVSIPYGGTDYRRCRKCQGKGVIYASR